MEEKRELRKKLNTLDVTAITAGIVIGAGLSVVTGIGAKYAGSFVWVSYLIAAIPCFMVAFSTSMLAQMYPVESGESFVYPTRIVSHLWGFLSGCAIGFILVSKFGCRGLRGYTKNMETP
jgi:APA family basic amino acid/polyamine antiporter